MKRAGGGIDGAGLSRLGVQGEDVEFRRSVKGRAWSANHGTDGRIIRINGQAARCADTHKADVAQRSGAGDADHRVHVPESRRPGLTAGNDIYAAPTKHAYGNNLTLLVGQGLPTQWGGQLNLKCSCPQSCERQCERLANGRERRRGGRRLAQRLIACSEKERAKKDRQKFLHGTPIAFAAP
ncbi:hypothetical protein GCM10010840_08700 [Deinococcus aerolatus]|uniref:Uncharacterized protein n=1 Tax=Deinococcus aerolatus TaxID=522487 RepID=A0ABQ2G315_9DEIO|nr:hypothetical protein GCM10010840_08700 [Deinococcus aerolatus]